MTRQSSAVRKNGTRSRVSPQSQVESKPARPTEDQIRQRAYELYLARGDGPGDALNDWVRAERELRERFASPGGGPGAGVRPRPRSRSAAP